MTAVHEPLLASATLASIARWADTRLPALGFTRRRWSTRRIRNDECFYNAYDVAKHYEGARLWYVEGFVVFDDGVVEHAWNALDGRHFDLTWEYHRPEFLRAPRYALLSGTPTELDARGYVFAPDRATMVAQHRARLTSPR
jgi:hypothetical protein